MKPEVTCVISGSFPKAKDRIDKARDCFEANNIRVLSPDKGGLYYPENKLWAPGSYPLASELAMSEVEAKERHTQAIRKANFLYVCAPNGYLGESAPFEVGVAYCCDIPIYAAEEIDPFLDYGLSWQDHIAMFQIKSPEEVAKIWKDLQFPRV